MKSLIINDIIMNLFILSILFQSFAPIKTENYGISFLTLMCIFVFLVYNRKLLFKKKYIYFLLIINIYLFINLLFNQMFNILKILRFNMLYFIIITTFMYMNFLNSISKIDEFFQKFINYSIFVCVYGLYQKLSYKYMLPQFLNIFIDNPSYVKNSRDLFYIYGGWVEKERLYATFFEPSVYAVFLVVVYVILIYSKSSSKINKFKKLILFILLIINLYFTYSRTGWGAIFYIVILVTINKIVRIEKLKKLFFINLIIILPFLNMFVLKYFNEVKYTDLSSKARISSPIYYLKNSLDSPCKFLIGHGLGSIQSNYSLFLFEDSFVESYAHNGYVEFIYELGIVWLLFFIIFYYRFCYKINDNDKRFVYGIILPVLMGFEQFIYIESILSILILTYYIFLYDVERL